MEILSLAMAPFLSSRDSFQTPKLTNKRHVLIKEKMNKFKRLFRPEYTSTPNYSLPKTSTPVMKRLSSSIETIEKRSFKNYRINSTFKEEITPKKLFIKTENQPKRFKYISSRVKSAEKSKPHKIIVKISSAKQCKKCRTEFTINRLQSNAEYRRARRNEKLMKQLIYEPNINYHHLHRRHELIQLEKIHLNFFSR